jgi:hypothetical protein
MNLRRLIVLPILSLCAAFATCAQAQHSDIEFNYDSGQVALYGVLPSFLDANWVFEGNFPTSGISQNFTTNPGFASEILEGLGIGANDVIDYQIAQSATLGSVLTYYDPTTFGFAPTSATITIDDNGAMGGSWVVGNSSGVGSGPGVVGVADGMGDFHSHMDFILSNGAATGAYGLLMTLNTNAPGINDSAPFWVVFNYGMTQSDFDNFAIPAFQAIPEPGALGLLSIATLGLLGYRRRKLTVGQKG